MSTIPPSTEQSGGGNIKDAEIQDAEIVTDPASQGPDAAPNAPGTAGAGRDTNHTLRPLEALHGVELEITVELGRARMNLRDLLGVHIGSLIELDRAAGSPVDVLVSGVIVARGEVVVVEDEFAVRVTELVDSSEAKGHG